MSASRLLLLAVALLPITAFAQAEPPRALNPLGSLDKATLKGFVEKPLFETSRQPPFVAAPLARLPLPPPPPVVEPPPALRLIGIVEGSGTLAAIVHRDDTGKTETLRSGDHIGEWSVEVLPAAVRVVSGQRAFDYALFRGRNQQGPAVAADDPAGTAPR